MKDLDELLGRPQRYKPRVVELVESFEEKYRNDLPEGILTKTACMAIALFFFGPLENEDLALYAAMIGKRVEDYRIKIN